MDSFYLKKHNLAKRPLIVDCKEETDLTHDYRKYDRVILHAVGLNPGLVIKKWCQYLDVEKTIMGWGTMLVICKPKKEISGVNDCREPARSGT